MKIFTLFFALLLSSLTPALAHAADPSFWNPCTPSNNCVPEAQKIADEFMSAEGIKEAALPLLASGSCYHRTYELDPNTEHFGVVLLDTHEGSNYTNGQYGFFYKENPYKDWTIQTAFEHFTDPYTPNHRIKLHDDYAFADMSSPNGGAGIVRYWMREKNSTIYVVGQWGNSHTMICRMEKNPKQ